MIRKHIDISEYETWKLKKILFNTLERKNNYYDSILQFYDLYCKGYNFLDNLGIGYGLTLDCPYSEYGVDSYEELTQEQKDKVVDSFYPKIKFEIKKVLDWLDSDLIVIQSEYDSYGNLKITDNRLEADKEPTAYKIAKTVDKKNKREWWKIWI